jgi:hypothetical protein
MWDVLVLVGVPTEVPDQPSPPGYMNIANAGSKGL